MASKTAKSSQLLEASYDSPTNESFSYVQDIAAPKNGTTSERVAYLGALRKATASLQEHINKELTQRMEDDKSKEAANAAAKGKTDSVVDEGKEEENYGEEVAEDED